MNNISTEEKLRQKKYLPQVLWLRLSGTYTRGGGIWGMCPPPLEPNAQRKNLRRLKDLRRPIQRKSPKLLTRFFFSLKILLSLLFNL